MISVKNNTRRNIVLLLYKSLIAMLKITLLWSWDTLWTPVAGCLQASSLSALQHRIDKRYRFWILIEYNRKKILIDTNPDIKRQCLEYNLDLGDIDSIIITHTHSDHVNWMGEFWRKKNIPCYYPKHPLAEKHIDYFRYLERESVLHFISYENQKTLEVCWLQTTPLSLNHWFPTRWFVFSYKDKKIGICSDTNLDLCHNSLEAIHWSDILFLDWFSEDDNWVIQLLNDCGEIIGNSFDKSHWYHSSIRENKIFQKQNKIKKLINIHISRYCQPHNQLVEQYETETFIIGYDWQEIYLD